MDAEFQVLSPLVPLRQVRFIRFCKQHSEGVWAVVDVSIDASQDATNTQMLTNCRRLPSGCVIQEMEKYSKVIGLLIWIIIYFSKISMNEMPT